MFFVFLERHIPKSWSCKPKWLQQLRADSGGKGETFGVADPRGSSPSYRVSGHRYVPLPSLRGYGCPPDASQPLRFAGPAIWDVPLSCV